MENLSQLIQIQIGPDQYKHFMLIFFWMNKASDDFLPLNLQTHVTVNPDFFKSKEVTKRDFEIHVCVFKVQQRV